MNSLRVQFIHGLEGSPSGAKARLLAKHFDALTPAMDTGDFEASVEVQHRALAAFEPDVLVGSSFGGAVAVELLQQGRWSGPTLLLAQAAVRRGQSPVLPPDVPIWIVHGRSDGLIDPADSRLLAGSGSPSWVRLLEVDDDHALHQSVESELLIDWVRDLAAWRPVGPAATGET